MNTDEEINEQEEELANIILLIIGLPESGRKSDNRRKLNPGYLLYNKGNENNFVVGFIINKTYK